MGLPTSAPGIPTSPGPREAACASARPCPGAPGSAPLGARPLPAPLTCDRGEVKQQQAKEEGGERTEAAGRHGAEPGWGAGVSSRQDEGI